MTNILGLIKDSVGNVVSGTLSFQLPTAVLDDTTTPDSIYTKIPFEFNIVDGVVDVDVPPTEEPGVAYRIRFIATGDITPTLDFNAAVPNVSTVEFNLLVPTGITNLTLDTGAFRVSRAIANNSILSQLFKQPIASTLSLDGQSTESVLRFPKPFPGAIRFRGLSVLSTSGYADWTFTLGVIRTDGTDSPLVADSSTNAIENGRLFRTDIFDQTWALETKGLYIQATPGVGSAPITATITATYTEV